VVVASASVIDAARRGLVLALGLLVVGCTASGGTSSGPATPGATATSVPSPSPSPSPTPSTPPAATATIRASTGTVVAIDDPALSVTLPERWGRIPLEDYRLIVANELDGSSGAARTALRAHLADIDGGAVRLVAGGRSGLDPWSATMVFQMRPRAATLDEAIEAVDRMFVGLGAATGSERHPVTLAVGDGIRRVATHPLPPAAPSGGVPAQTVEYFIGLADGRTLWILATAPAGVATFPALIDAAVASLRAG
jgi:hypothetical protein